MAKGPTIEGWPKLRISRADAPRFFNGARQNVGVILGQPSGNLVDIDLDCTEAVALAPALLPPTESVFGRSGKSRSHWLYQSAVPKLAQFVDPDDGETLLEVRSTGGQTVFPGSTHATGEPIQWHEDGDQAEVDPNRLITIAGELAAACLLVRAAPADNRNRYMLEIAGALVRGLGVDGAAHILAPVGRLVFGKLYSKAAEERLIADTDSKIAEGKPASGWPTLTKAIGEKRARKVSDWLGLSTQEPTQEQPTVEWPEPVDIIGAPELVGWPTLTAECIPGPLYHYVKAEAERMNVDPCPLAGHVITACATSISDQFTVKPKQFDHYTQQARVWVCVVKNVGARGTEMINSAFWPLKERNAELHKSWTAEHSQWKDRQGKKKDKDDPEPKHQRVLTSDATVESMSEILRHGGPTSKLGAIYDELVTFLGGFGRYNDNGGGAARGVILEAYDGGPQWIDRIKRGHVYVPNWSLVVAGNIQPRRLANMAPYLIDDGLFQRFLTLHTRPAALGVHDDKPSAPSVGKDYRELHTTLAGMSPVVGTDGKSLPCYFDADARAERQRFMRLVERLQADPTLPTIIRETSPKWSGLLARLALVFHIVELAEQRNNGAVLSLEDICHVTGRTVIMASTFLRRVALPNLFRLGFETMPEAGAAAGHARWIAKHVLAHGSDTITARDIGRAYNELRGKVDEIATAMAMLVDTGWAALVESRKDGLRWAVNPAVHERFAAAATEEKARRRAVVELIRTRVQDL